MFRSDIYGLLTSTELNNSNPDINQTTSAPAAELSSNAMSIKVPEIPTHITSAMQLNDDLQMSEYFARPRLIAKYDPVSSPPAAAIDIHKTLVPLYGDKIKDYKYMSGCLRITINYIGNPTCRGTTVLSFFPTTKVGSLDGFTASQVVMLPTWFNTPCTALSQCKQLPHIQINHEELSTYTICLPFCSSHGSMNIISDSSWFMVFGELNQIVMNDGSTPSNFPIEVYASYEDVKFYGLVKYEGPDLELPPAALSKAMSYMSYISSLSPNPFVSTFSKVMALGSTVAMHMGYSRPLEPASKAVVVKNSSTTYNSGENDFSTKLAMSPFTTSDLNPSLIPMAYDGETKLSNLFSKWGLIRILGSLTLPVTLDVNPSQAIYNFTGATPLWFFTMPFSYWSGSIDYKFEFVANSLVRQRFVIYVYPTGSLVPTISDASKVLTTFVNVCGRTEVIVNVPYTSEYNFTKLDGTVDMKIAIHALSPPQGTTSAIAINVYVRGGSDYKVAMPDPTTISSIKFEGPDRVISVTPASQFGEEITDLMSLCKIPCLVAIPDAHSTGGTGSDYTELMVYPIYGRTSSESDMVIGSAMHMRSEIQWRRSYLDYCMYAFYGYRGGKRFKLGNWKKREWLVFAAQGYNIIDVSQRFNCRLTGNYAMQHADMIEVEIPYKSNNRFLPCRAYSTVTYQLPVQNTNSYSIVLATSEWEGAGETSQKGPLFTSGSEDSVLGFFLCAPVINWG